MERLQSGPRLGRNHVSFFERDTGCSFSRQCYGFHRRAKPEECTNCGAIDHKFTECTRPKEAKKSYKWQGGKEKGKGEGKGDWKGKKGEWSKGEWKGGKGDKGEGKGGDKGGYKGKGKSDEIKTVVKSAIEAEKKAEKDEKEKHEKEEKEKAEKDKE